MALHDMGAAKRGLHALNVDHEHDDGGWSDSAAVAGDVAVCLSSVDACFDGLQRGLDHHPIDLVSHQTLPSPSVCGNSCYSA